ncbi:phosphatidate cytidylyltransferase [Campylobacter geochelonis]|uniref:Phosphatidate cytidylyltransferase n=1 Tax=Campylobacter geochelonis TaxID=1780362 RepID=A0A128EEP0_9BACT|nr:phosphatidate cytidylyltransferase [Campylobacter geochelonis]QKF72113.1 CDP-diglyceride synthetase [Campylobacter geochelonis]CZE46708.1 phosphatidate cytidylyltransferase [Campylobacter geochelonis]
MITRIKTAAVLLAAFLLIVWIDSASLNFIIFAIILATAFIESLKLYKIENQALVALTLILFAGFAYFIDDFSTVYKFIVFMLLILSSFFVYQNSQNLKSILPFLYPTAPIFAMFAIYDIFGIRYLVFMIFVVICSDSGAYFIGKAFGKHKFSLTSPNKTLEGVAGGVVCGVIGGYIFGLLFLKDSEFATLLTCALVAVFGIFGDLFESYLKRQAGVKDSGEIFPGHGGMLDRIDGYLFAAIYLSLVLPW